MLVLPAFERYINGIMLFHPNVVHSFPFYTISLYEHIPMNLSQLFLTDLELLGLCIFKTCNQLMFNSLSSHWQCMRISVFVHPNTYLHILANRVSMFPFIYLPFRFLLLGLIKPCVSFPKSCLHILDINPMSVVSWVTTYLHLLKIHSVCLQSQSKY